MSETVLRAENIYKSYGDTEALSGVNFDMNAGEIHSLLGPNGAGKTTLIKIMATLLRKDSGNVNIMGYDLDNQEQKIKQVLGYVGQDTERSAYARLTPIENLRFFGALRGLSNEQVDETVFGFAEYIDFEDKLDEQFMHLSGGQKQVVIIMRALLHDPPIIFLDEPTKGLDPLISNKIRTFLKRYTSEEGKSLLLTSHIMNEVDELSDRVSLIQNGEIPITGSPSDLKQSVGINDFISLEKGSMASSIIDQIEQLEVVINKLEKEEGWISFGLEDMFEGTQQVLQVLKSNNVKPRIKQHSVSLEEAFIHHIGELEERFV